MTTSPETSPRTTGAQQAHRKTHDREAQDRAAAQPSARRPAAQRPPTRYDPYLDGLFTYCLSVLCDHDTAIAALAGALRLAERRRGPVAPDDRRPRLYALARWACLRELAGTAPKRLKRRGAPASGRPGTGERRAPDPTPAVPPETQARRRRELARLAWPEAAGTTPGQREALELAVRHQLTAHEIAAVLRTTPASARELLASAACEVERTRAALAVVESGTCPGVSRLTHDHRLILSTTLRRELVRHVDDCPRCRRTAEHVTPGRWPGTSVTPAALPLVDAPRAALRTAMDQLTRARCGSPRLDRRGFPMDFNDRAARRGRLRTRAVTTTVVATVVAAPVLAAWAAFRDAPSVGDGADGRAVTVREAHDADGADGAGDGAGGTGGTAGHEHADSAGTGPGRTGKDADASGVVSTVPGPGAGELAVEAAGDGDTTLITLTASGHAPVAWSARTDAHWLYFSRSSGTLAPGASVTIKVHVDRLREPAGHWRAQVSVAPAGAVVSIEGYGPTAGPSDPRPDDARPSDPRPASPGPRPGSTAPGTPPSTPAPEPAPGAPGSSAPAPTPSSPATATTTGPGGPGPQTGGNDSPDGSERADG
ncbi:BACON domain-containing protein [Streptomyces poonensis]|uniref:BACON domain-containing protein n=1 Tax=Streptomyces poonensis TaxID=68255 RepID=A0A918UJI9_9ACTN|nr:hypothetical protein [Streptomyces poonensis]GGZ14514.1 hypothetical protein GCM10010365_38080 [Streptomyces poonensis]GLJ93302.1 hypothetical protein GCM10017589_59140 [Streptomyces poonensis]